jgi:hypothetical protein
MRNVIPFPLKASDGLKAHAELLMALADLRNGLTLLSLISAHAELRGEPLPTDERTSALLDGIAEWFNTGSAASWRSASPRR